jgi:hypothetical protein
MNKSIIMDEKGIPIYGVYFICCLNNYLEVIEQQMLSLKKGLLNKTKKVIIFITNYDVNDVKLNELLLNFNENDNFILVTSPDNLYEKFAINNYKKYINDDEYYVYYFHTKGVTQINNWYGRSIRKILNIFTLEKYNINIKLLLLYDAVGCSLSLYPKKHFSGNFWWSKSNYVKYLKSINDTQGYLAPEMYILSNDNCNPISLANDTNDIFIENYIFNDDNTILSNITQQYRIIEEDKNVLHLC